MRAGTGIPPEVRLQLHRLGAEPGLPPTAEMLTFLDRVERRRADRYAVPDRAAAFVAGRYVLRLFAADLVGAEPRALVSDSRCPVCARIGTRIEAGIEVGIEAGSDHGRPGYLLDGDRVHLALSLSRTAGAILVGALDLRDPRGIGAATGRTGADATFTGAAGGKFAETGIGVDIDAVSGVVFGGFDDVALSRAERERVATLPRRRQDTERARLWVRKEALVKARGTGFHPAGPADVEVPAHPAIIDLEKCDGVTLARLGLVAAVAVM